MELLLINKAISLPIKFLTEGVEARLKAYNPGQIPYTSKCRPSVN